ncbi:3440_t:CDS:2 [Acaulospora morrowiae]|uniref:3440_t:CDS:1 n=1 Tax=Acaulospora morrowiae TaxID=94023 RepID=A0A9N8ZSC5_9GLOM|nr:3440_t:CDS:2 [Acaulospora morrowiae]
MKLNYNHDLLQDIIKRKDVVYVCFNEFSGRREIAKGAYAEVFKAYWSTKSTTVALKRLFDNSNNFQILLHELKLIQALESHDNIIKFYGITRDPENKYSIILEYSNGGNLRDYLRKKFSSLNWSEKIDIAKQIACGLSYIHNKNVTHRDLWCHYCNAKRFLDDSKNWTSGNPIIDKFILDIQVKASNSDEVIEWIPFDKLKNVTLESVGSYNRFYKAEWQDGYIVRWNNVNNEWDRCSNKAICLRKSKYSYGDVYSKFLREIQFQLTFRRKGAALSIYGITKDPRTMDYIMVMDYANDGSLQGVIDDKFERLDWNIKMANLYLIIKSLNEIHKEGLVHKNIHLGSIVCHGISDPYLSGFIFCGRVSDNPINYPPIKYIAPEVLSKDRKHTKASDIYSFGIVMLEILIKNLPPTNNNILANTKPSFLAYFYNRIINIIKPRKNRLRAQTIKGGVFITSSNIPRLLKNLIIRCLDVNPDNRPTCEELIDVFTQVKSRKAGYYIDESSELYRQIQEIELSNN